MKPVNLIRFSRKPPSAVPPVGKVDLKFDPETGSFVQVNADGTTSELGGLADTGLVTVETVEGTSYYLTAADSGKMLYFTSGSTITLAVEVELPAGFNVGVVQGGAGAVSFNPAGVTLNGAETNHETTEQWAVASLLILSSGVAVLKGDVTISA